MITTDLLLKTYPTDYDWLPFLFRSLPRVTGYRNLLVLLEEQYPEPEGLPANARVIRSRRYVDTDIPSGMGAVVERLRAWSYTDAERLLFVDSDCVFIRPVDIQTEPTINVEKPVVVWRTWEESGPGKCWRPRAASVLGYDPQIETMVRYPFCFPTSLMRAFWDFVGGEERLLHLPEMNDWNALGNYALDKHPDEVTKVYWTDAGAPCLRQFWSWHRPTHPGVQAELGSLGVLS